MSSYPQLPRQSWLRCWKIWSLCSSVRLLADDWLNGRIGLPASSGEADNRTAAP